MEEYENVIKQARKGMHDAVCKYLIGGGVADPLPEWPKTLTCTLMQCALQACRVDIAEVLLKYGAKTTTVFNKSYLKYFPFKKNSTMTEKEHVLRFLIRNGDCIGAHLTNDDPLPFWVALLKAGMTDFLNEFWKDEWVEEISSVDLFQHCRIESFAFLESKGLRPSANTVCTWILEDAYNMKIPQIEGCIPVTPARILDVDSEDLIKSTMLRNKRRLVYVKYLPTLSITEDVVLPARNYVPYDVFGAYMKQIDRKEKLLFPPSTDDTEKIRIHYACYAFAYLRTMAREHGLNEQTCLNNVAGTRALLPYFNVLVLLSVGCLPRFRKRIMIPTEIYRKLLAYLL
jgi:hypothetical protein